MNRVSFSDIIELSAQRFAVQTQTRQRVTDHGYVLIKLTEADRKQIPHWVELLPARELITLAFWLGWSGWRLATLATASSFATASVSYGSTGDPAIASTLGVTDER